MSLDGRMLAVAEAAAIKVFNAVDALFSQHDAKVDLKLQEFESRIESLEARLSPPSAKRRVASGE